MLVWDNEPGIGQHRRLTLSARSFADTLGTRIYQAAARDPETKGVIERARSLSVTRIQVLRQAARSRQEAGNWDVHPSR